MTILLVTNEALTERGQTTALIILIDQFAQLNEVQSIGLSLQRVHLLLSQIPWFG